MVKGNASKVAALIMEPVMIGVRRPVLSDILPRNALQLSVSYTHLTLPTNREV